MHLVLKSENRKREAGRNDFWFMTDKSNMTLTQKLDREHVGAQLTWLLKNYKLNKPYLYRSGEQKGKQTNRVTQLMLAEIAGLTAERDQTPYTTKQIYNWIHGKSDMPADARKAIIAYFSLDAGFFEREITKEEVHRQEIDQLFKDLQSSSQIFGEKIISGMDLYGRPLNWDDVISDPKDDTVATLSLLSNFDPHINDMIEAAKQSETATIDFFRLGYMFQSIIEQLWLFFKVQGSEYLKHTGKFPDGTFYDFEDAGERYGFIVSCTFGQICEPILKFAVSPNDDFYTKVPYKENSRPADGKDIAAEQEQKGK